MKNRKLGIRSQRRSPEPIRGRKRWSLRRKSTNLKSNSNRWLRHWTLTWSASVVRMSLMTCWRKCRTPLPSRTYPSSSSAPQRRILELRDWLGRAQEGQQAAWVCFKTSVDRLQAEPTSLWRSWTALLASSDFLRSTVWTSGRQIKTKNLALGQNGFIFFTGSNLEEFDHFDRMKVVLD